jgi:hypothetical protein
VPAPNEHPARVQDGRLPTPRRRIASRRRGALYRAKGFTAGAIATWTAPIRIVANDSRRLAEAANRRFGAEVARIEPALALWGSGDSFGHQRTDDRCRQPLACGV